MILDLALRQLWAVLCLKVSVEDTIGKMYLRLLGFESRISDVGRDRSTNWATTTAQTHVDFCATAVEWLRKKV